MAILNEEIKLENRLSTWNSVCLYNGNFKRSKCDKGRSPDNGHEMNLNIDFTCVISSSNPMFDHLLESSRWDDSNKRSNIGFSQEMDILGIQIRALSGALQPCLPIDNVIRRK